MHERSHNLLTCTSEPEVCNTVQSTSQNHWFINLTLNPNVGWGFTVKKDKCDICIWRLFVFKCTSVLCIFASVWRKMNLQHRRCAWNTCSLCHLFTFFYLHLQVLPSLPLELTEKFTWLRTTFCAEIDTNWWDEGPGNVLLHHSLRESHQPNPPRHFPRSARHRFWSKVICHFLQRCSQPAAPRFIYAIRWSVAFYSDGSAVRPELKCS